MPHPKVKLSDDSGNAVSVTSNRLDVNAYLSATPTIDIGDVSLLLGGTAASVNAGTMDAQTLRVTLATNDTHFGTVGEASDDDGTIHGQLRAISNGTGLTKSAVDTSNTHLGTIKLSIQTAGAAFAAWDGGNRVLAVRNDTLANLDATIADGDYTPFQVNASGALYIDIADGGQLDTLLDTLETTLTAIETDQAAIEALLTTIDVDTGSTAGSVLNIKNATYADDDDWTDGSSRHMLVGGLYQSSMQSVTDGDVAPFQIDANGVLKVVGTVDLGSTDNTVLDNILTKNTEIDAVLDTIKVDTEAIETAVELLDNAISGSEMQVDVVASLPAGSAAIGKLAANSGVDIGDVDVTSTVQPVGFSAVAQFTTNIGTSATQLDAQACKHADVMAKVGNAGIVYIGGSSVAATTGIALYPGDVYSVEVTNTNLLYAIAISDNDDLQVVYYA